MPRTPLPTLSSFADFPPLHARSDLWLAAVDEIRARHGLGRSPLVRCPDGANVIFFAGDAHVIKIFGPLWREQQLAERAGLTHVAGRLPVRTPGVVGDGEIDGWPYLVLERLPGEPLASVWPTLPDDDRAAVARELGGLIRSLHRLPVEGLGALAVDWSAFVAARRARCVEQHQKKGAPAELLAGITAAIAAGEPLFSPGFTPVLVHADVTDGNVLLERRGSGWAVGGLIDFGDAMVGHADYDLVSTAEFLLCGRPPLLRAFLVGYGFAEDELDETLAARLMALTLLHRFADLSRFVQKVAGPARFETLEELTRFAWRT